MLDFGIEIEFIANGHSQNTVAAAVSATGVSCFAAGYSHTFEPTRWKVVSDGSINGGTGFELVSPPFPCVDEAGTRAAFESVEKVCTALAALNATVNRSCGLHVHIGARNHSINALKKLAALYVEHEPVIDELLPASRRGSANDYCKSITAADVTRLKAASDISAIATALHADNRGEARYVKLNFTSFWRHGTVEFRHHSGTVDAAKIIKWVTLCTKMVETAVREADEPITLEGTASTTRLTNRLTATVSAGYSTYWRSGRRTRILFNLLTRPQGVTAEEARVELGVRTRPQIMWHANRAQGDRVVEAGRQRLRGGMVFRLVPPTTATLAAAPAPVAAAPTTPRPRPTLEGLFTRLALSEEERAFWNARRAFLAAQGGERVHNP